MAAPAHLARVRSLYKRILVLHRFLPDDLKALGDGYVRDEFRRHKTAAKAEVARFLTEWEAYRDTLQTQVLDAARGPPGQASFGAALPEEALLHLQEQQVGQLYQLMLETRGAGTRVQGPEPR